jgi:hypothetical protein
MKGLFIGLLGIALMAGLSAATITYLNPNGNGAYSEWTNVGCLSTSEYQCVDEDPGSHDTSDYLYASAPFVYETFAFENLGTCSNVNYVALGYYASSNETRYLLPIMRIHWNIYVGTPIEIHAYPYQWYAQYFFTNPYTGHAWTCAEVNDLEAGMESTGSSGVSVATMYARASYT